MVTRPTRKRLTPILIVGALAALAWSLVAQTSTPLEASGQVPYLTTNSTSTSFPSTVAERTLTAPSNLFSLGPTAGKRYRGVTITAYGTGTATTTFDYKIWVVRRGVSGLNGSLVDYQKQLYCHGTCTLGTSVGAATAGQGITSSDKICDTITVTMDAYGTALVTAYGGVAASVYSPGSNGIAELLIPEFGNSSDFFVEFDRTGANSCNFLIERGT